MATLDSRHPDLTSEPMASVSPSSPARGSRSPRQRQPPSSDARANQDKKQNRHSKKLSLSFPILVPAKGVDTPTSYHTASPTALSAYSTTQGSFFSPQPTHTLYAPVPSSMSLHMPLTPPSEEEPVQAISRSHSRSKSHVRQESTSSDFLTVLASQERRVLELREELARAEAELITFKKHWALHEAGKKKDEIKGAPVMMRSAAKTHTRAASVIESGTGLGLMGIDEPANDEKLEAEREKRREIARERMMGRVTNPELAQSTTGNTKKTGQRVFQGSRHTRTLSLLTAANSTRSEQTDSLDSANNSKSSLDSTRQSLVDTPPTNTTISTPSLSRTNSALDGINFGKTYKDLASAASRKNLPQGLSPEQFVKHGKQVVDGVRDGLWNFFEDIRQATVGEEAINGTGNGMRRQPSTRDASSGANTKLKRTLTDGGNKSTMSRRDLQKENETSFWKEFGVDTPKSDKTKRNSVGKEKRPSLPGRWPSTKTGEDLNTCSKHRHDNVNPTDAVHSSKSAHRKEGAEHHESKSSTDSRNPPSLLADLLDDEDEGWDNWDSNTDPESPQSARKRSKQLIESRSKSKSEVAGAKSHHVDVKEVQWHDLV